MKKIAALIVIVFAAVLIGIFIGKSKLFDKPVVEDKEEVEVDTAMVNAEKKYENKYPTYTVAGGLPQVRDKYRNIVDRWYNFNFVVNGSNCTDPSNQNVDVKHNNRTDSILKKRIGKNWMELFEKTADSLFLIDSLAIAITENDRAVKNIIKQKSLKDVNAKNARYKCYPTTDKNVKLVSAEWSGIIYRDTTEVSFFRAIVDIKNKKVKEIERTEREGFYPYFF